MSKKFYIDYTSDIHGYLSPINYLENISSSAGLSNCMTGFRKDGNTLHLDGGDILQGSPLSEYLISCEKGPGEVTAELMNIAGYDAVTLGNHDFSYGLNELKKYLKCLQAKCLCANVSGIPGIKKSAVFSLENGLRIGICGVITPLVPSWEKAENIEGVTFFDPVRAAETEWKKLHNESDVTVCICHFGYENDLEDEHVISCTGEDRAFAICKMLHYDIVLTGHKHAPLEGRILNNSFTCQPPDKATAFIELSCSIDHGRLQTESKLMAAGSITDSNAWNYLAPLEEKNATWLDSKIGSISESLLPGERLQMAVKGSKIADLVNQIQLSYCDADISCTSLPNEVSGFQKSVSLRDVLANYPYSNTLKVLRVDRAILKSALERCAQYFELSEEGKLRISPDFLHPFVQHFNFDFFYGLGYSIDIFRPIGDRVISIRFQGKELPVNKSLRLCLNNYRSSGAGGFPCYTEANVLYEGKDEVSSLIITYFMNHPVVSVKSAHDLKIYNKGAIIV